MRIAVVDDQSSDRQQVADMVRLCCDDMGLQASVWQYESGAALMDTWEEDPFDIVFLDIYMGDINGMELAGQLRALDQTVKLVFITVTAAFAQDGYDVAASYYLTKPVQREKMEKALHRCLDGMAQDSRFVVLKAGYQEYTVLLRNILFVRKQGNYIFVHTLGGVELKVHLSLVQFLNLVGDDGRFLQCYQSHIVNLQHVVGISDCGEGFELDNGMVIPMAKKQRTALHAAWVSYEAQLLREGL